MGKDPEVPEGDERYFEDESTAVRVFDANLLKGRLDVLPLRGPLVFSPSATVTDAMRGMQGERCGCVLVTEDGTPETKVVGIFTERDVLFRVVDGGRNPATLPLAEVMTADPACVPREASIARALKEMAVGGFRHIPVVKESGCPVFVVSVRDVVELLVESFPQEILNLPPRHGGDQAKEREGA